MRSLFWIQNKWHQHGVLVHTLRVVYYTLKATQFKMLGAAFLHDVGKPFTAFVKDEEDRKYGEYSFTDHEEKSYQIIKNWPFISEYTKQLVRYHYLIRDIKKSTTENIQRHKEKVKIWDTLSEEMHQDLHIFLAFDDAGKGQKRREDKTIIYGDIHGCFEEFVMLRDKIGIDCDDKEIIAGDVLNKGPHSNEALEFIRKNNITLIMGNNEHKYVSYQKHLEKFKKSNKKNPMKLNKKRLDIYNGISELDMKYLQESPYFLKIDNTTILHGGITNTIDLDQATQKELEQLTILKDIEGQHWSELYDGRQGTVVYGHNVFENVKIDKYSFGIDTGCVYGGKLTALVLSNTKNPMQNYEIIQVDALEKYAVKK